MTIARLTAKANLLKNRIEADLHAAGLDPAMGDYHHPLNAEWLEVREEIRERMTVAVAVTAAFRR